jgi:hypothetical protein
MAAIKGVIRRLARHLQGSDVARFDHRDPNSDFAAEVIVRSVRDAEHDQLTLKLHDLAQLLEAGNLPHPAPREDVDQPLS